MTAGLFFVTDREPLSLRPLHPFLFEKRANYRSVNKNKKEIMNPTILYFYQI